MEITKNELFTRFLEISKRCCKKRGTKHFSRTKPVSGFNHQHKYVYTRSSALRSFLLKFTPYGRIQNNGSKRKVLTYHETSKVCTFQSLKRRKTPEIWAHSKRCTSSWYHKKCITNERSIHGAQQLCGVSLLHHNYKKKYLAIVFLLFETAVDISINAFQI